MTVRKGEGSYRGEMSAYKQHGTGQRVTEIETYSGEWNEGQEHG